MGLFSRHAEEPAPRQPVYEEPPKKHGLFGSRHESPTRTHPGATHSTRSSTSSMSPDSRSSQRAGGGGGLLSRFGNGSRDMDPSIVEARERLTSAERAEMDADRALMAARASVREAREHVRMLEVEAKEEARKAMIKQQHAKEFSKRGKQLGRYGQ